MCFSFTKQSRRNSKGWRGAWRPAVLTQTGPFIRASALPGSNPYLKEEDTEAWRVEEKAT